MYRQQVFASEESTGYDLVASAQAGFICATGATCMVTSFVPVLVNPAKRTITFHVAAANPLCEALEESPEVTGLFTRRHGYISPSWYERKQVDGKVVPTWNYEAAEVHGHATVHRDEATILDVVTSLTDLHESDQLSPWKVSDAPADYISSLTRSICAVTISVTEIIATVKMSQNRSRGDRDGVIAGLVDLGDHDLAEAVRLSCDKAGT